MSRHRKAYDDDDLYDDYDDDYYEEDDYPQQEYAPETEAAPSAPKMEASALVGFVIESLGQSHLSEARVLQMLNMYDCDVEKTIAFFAKEKLSSSSTAKGAVTAKAASGQKAVNLSSSKAASATKAPPPLAAEKVGGAASNKGAGGGADAVSTPSASSSASVLLTARAPLSDEEESGAEEIDDDAADDAAGEDEDDLGGRPKGTHTAALTPNPTPSPRLSQLTMVVAGHVDAGKSTLVGHLLFKSGQVAQRTLNKFQDESAQAGKGSFALAWVMDEGESEREHGVTINVGERSIVSGNRQIRLLDAPGHRDYIPSLLAGASTADVALLVVPATVGEFESSMGDKAQTREHAILLRALGVGQVLVAVNKMDAVSVGWSQARYQAVVQRVRAMLGDVQFRHDNIRFVPVSGLSGENLTEPPAAGAGAASMPTHPLASWYSGPTLLQAIHAFEDPSASAGRNKSGAARRPFRAVVSAVYGGSGAGGGEGGLNLSDARGSVSQVRVQVLQGSVGVGRGVGLAGPMGGTATITKMTTEEGGPLRCARAGRCAVFWLLDRSGRCAREVGATQGLVLTKGPPLARCVTMFKASILTTSALAVPIIPGSSFELYIHGLELQCTVERLYSMTTEGELGHDKVKHPRCVPANRQASVLIRVLGSGVGVCVERFKDCQALGRFALRSKGVTAAIGVCRKLPPSTTSSSS